MIIYISQTPNKTDSVSHRSGFIKWETLLSCLVCLCTLEFYFRNIYHHIKSATRGCSRGYDLIWEKRYENCWFLSRWACWDSDVLLFVNIISILWISVPLSIRFVYLLWIMSNLKQLNHDALLQILLCLVGGFLPSKNIFLSDSLHFPFHCQQDKKKNIQDQQDFKHKNGMLIFSCSFFVLLVDECKY